MNKKYLILGALLLVGGYIAYKKFYVNKEEEETTDNTSSSSPTIEAPIDRGIVAPPIVETKLPEMVSQSAPTLQIESANVSTASSAPSGNLSYAGLGKY